MTKKTFLSILLLPVVLNAQEQEGKEKDYAAALTKGQYFIELQDDEMCNNGVAPHCTLSQSLYPPVCTRAIANRDEMMATRTGPA